jgi:putative component of membrane protein insertase Oxa1/YidC/SpoIIIJ protein YidD
MKWLMLISIRFYWWVIPPSKRNRCIFKESCSNAVYRETKENGLFFGLRMFHYRFQNCRSGYHLVLNNGVIDLITVKKNTIPHEEIHPRLMRK